MKRAQDWPQRLDEYIATRRDQPWEWGRNDCCQFAAGAVEAMTGEHPAPQWTYDNEFGATRIIVEAGSLQALVTSIMGEPVHASRAGRGDVVMMEFEEGMTVGVCLGRDCAFVSSEGMVFRSRTDIVAAWLVR